MLPTIPIPTFVHLYHPSVRPKNPFQIRCPIPTFPNDHHPRPPLLDPALHILNPSHTKSSRTQPNALFQIPIPNPRNPSPFFDQILNQRKKKSVRTGRKKKYLEREHTVHHLEPYSSSKPSPSSSSAYSTSLQPLTPPSQRWPKPHLHYRRPHHLITPSSHCSSLC